MSVVFSPLATRLEPYCGRFVSAALVVLMVISFICATGYFLTIELTQVADQVSEYSDNIGNKIAALEKNTPPWLQHVKDAVTDVQQRVAGANPAPRSKPREVMALPVPSPLSDSLKPVAPIVDAVVNTLLIIVLLFFLLYSRKDLRDRFVRLAARARVPVAAQALETASYTVGRYLFLFSADQSCVWADDRNCRLVSRSAERGAVGPGRVPVAVYTVRRRDQFGVSAGAGCVCDVSRMGQGARNTWRLHHARPGGGADCRAVHHRSRDRRLAGGAAGIGDVLVVAVGNTGTTALDADDRVPESGGRLYSAARISLDPARRGSCARRLPRLLPHAARAESRRERERSRFTIATRTGSDELSKR